MTQTQVLAILKVFYMCVCVCVCVWGEGGPVTSFTFRNSRGGGVQHMLIRGGGGASNILPREWSPIAER